MYQRVKVGKLQYYNTDISISFLDWANFNPLLDQKGINIAIGL